MKEVFGKPKFFISFILFGCFLSFSISAQEKKQEEGYTINYTNVSLIEYVKFVGKVCGVNFIYDQEILQPYTISVVSDEPITRESLLSTLIQSLRIHGLNLLEQDNNFVISNVDSVRQLAHVLKDNDPIDSDIGMLTKVFRVKNTSVDSIAAIIGSMISEQAVLDVLTETRQIVITDITTNLERIEALIENLDSPETPLEIEAYHVKYNQPSYLIPLANQLMAPLSQGSPFILVPQQTTNTIYIVSTPRLVEKAIAVFNNLDIAEKAPAEGKQIKGENIFLYQPKEKEAMELIKALTKIGQSLKESGQPDKDLIETIDNIKYIPESNSILFTGNPSSIAKVQEMLANIDAEDDGLLPVSNQFLIYRPTHLTGEQILEALNTIAKNLTSAQLADPALLRAIESGKYNKDTQSVLFTGDAQTLQKLDILIKDIDNPESYPGLQTTYMIYPLKFVSRERAEQYLKQVVQNLNRSGLKNEPVVEAIKSMRWVPESRSLMFSGPAEALNELKNLLDSFDTSEEEQKHALSSYYLYKLENVSGAIVEEDLEKFARNLKATGLKDPELIQVLDNAKWVRETNSILLTGYPKTIEEAKTIIAQFDVKRDAKGVGQTDFLMYKPKNVPAEIIQKSLNEIASNLKKSDLADSSLLNAIKSMKYSDTTQSLIFTGDPEALKKLQVLLENIDDESARGRIQKIGETTFLLYKLKNASGTQIQSSIKQITKDLKKSSTSDKSFIDTLQSMKYVPETNSLLFTGNPASLEKVQELVEQFDVTSLAGPIEISGDNTFFVYKPRYLTGPQLQKQLEEFGDNLKMSGLSDPRLYQALNNTRWVETNKSLLITGDPQTLEKVKNLITQIDTPTDALAPEMPSLLPSEATNFLVYKLQYHKGEQIRGALRSIARDLLETNAGDKGLLEAINAIQWIEVTNSLLITGNQATLTRLRELVKSLDIPLKQVFIEVLVIETTLNNTLQFGLDWLGKGKWKNKAVTSFNNIAPRGAGGAFPFPTNFSSINATRTPVPTDLPFSEGFSFGAIGDIIFHKGRSFISLGSLMKALQQDNETTIVTTPKVFAQDSKKSTLFIGFNIPFVGSFVQNESQTTVSTTNIEYRDIGVNLEITPVLGNSDIVTLQLSLSSQSTDVSGQPTVVVNGVQGITTSKTSIESTFHVPNNNFLILTGMVTQTKNRNKAGIPCLGGLPLIGAAFSVDTNTENDRNIVIFLKPHIISSLADMQDITEQQEDYFREKSGNAVLENEFDEAMETIKSYEDE